MATDTAFERLSNTCAKRAWGLAYSLTRNNADAEDVMQHAYMAAWKRRDAIPDEHWPWFAKVVVNCVRNHRRKEARMKTNADFNEIRSPETSRPMLALEHDELRGELFAAMGTLAAEEQEALALCHFAGMSLSEASSVAGVNLSTFKARSSRALDKLRDRLKPRTRALEAYLATAAVPPPDGGWDLAISRWTDAAGSAVPSATGFAAIPKFAAALLVPLAIAGGLWFGVETIASGNEQSLSVFPSPAIAEAAPPTPPTAKAPALPSTPLPLYDPPASTMSDGVSGPPSPTDATRVHVVTPSGPVPIGTVRVRREYAEDGRLFAEYTEIVTANGAVRDGPRKVYYDGKAIWHEYYNRNGVASGPYIEYHYKGGVATRGAYLNGKPDGYWAMYHEDGWHSGGVTFVNGLREGEYRSWFKDARPESIVPFRGGEAHGTQLEYWESGKLKRKTQWEHGKKQGWDVKYDEDGNKTALFYKDGELVDPQPEYIEDVPAATDD